MFDTDIAVKLDLDSSSEIDKDRGLAALMITNDTVDADPIIEARTRLKSWDYSKVWPTITSDHLYRTQDPAFMQDGITLGYKCEHTYPINRFNTTINPNCLRGRDAAVFSAVRSLGLTGEILALWDESTEQKLPFLCSNPCKSEEAAGDQNKVETTDDVEDFGEGDSDANANVHEELDQDEAGGGSEEDRFIEDRARLVPHNAEEIADGFTTRIPIQYHFFDIAAAIVVQVPGTAE